MFASHRLLLSVCLLLGASACKSADPVQELCDLTLSCTCSMPPYATAEACVTDLNTRTDTYKTMATAQGLVFDQGCYDSTLALYHDELGCATTVDSSNIACSYCAIVHGDKPVGAVCQELGEFDDCAANLICDNNKCFDPCDRLAVDAPCAAIVNGAFESLGSCADGLYCDTAVSKTCKARVDVGGPCTGFFDCKDGLFCDTDKCAPAPKEGEACFIVCEGDLNCTDNVCTKRPGEGESCAKDGNCADELDCDDSQVCVAREPLLCDLLTDN